MNRDISQLLSISGVPKDKMSFIFRTPHGDVLVKYGYIVSGNSKANAHLIFELKKPNVKLNIEGLKQQEKGFINRILKKKG